VGRAWMASEFLSHNSDAAAAAVRAVLGGVPLEFEAHVDFKKRVPLAIGLIRTGDTAQYGNVVLESA
jgi:D-ribose pyranase